MHLKKSDLEKVSREAILNAFKAYGPNVFLRLSYILLLYERIFLRLFYVQQRINDRLDINSVFRRHHQYINFKIGNKISTRMF